MPVGGIDEASGGAARPRPCESDRAGARPDVRWIAVNHVKLSNRARRAAADLLFLFVLPGLVALLPWPLGFAVLKRCARVDLLYRSSVAPAWSAARRYLPDADETAWKRRHRLLRLVETVDSYLTLLRSRTWWRRRIVRDGDWPSPRTPTLLLTFHWGAGHWVWSQLRLHGIDAHFLARRPGPGDLGVGRLSVLYGRFRGSALRRIGSAGPLFLGGSVPQIEAAFAEGRSVVGMLDLPPRPGRSAFRASVLGRTAHLPSGLAELAVRSGVPVTIFSCGFDPETGARMLRIETLPADADVAQIMTRYAAHLDRCLRDQPAYWQMWSAADAIFETAAPQAAPAASPPAL